MKSRKAAILGLGHVGAHAASALCQQGIVDELVLIDANKQKLKSEVQDLNDALLWLPNSVRVYAGDFDDLKNADILIHSVGNIELLVGQSDRIHEMRFNLDAIDSYADKIKDSGFDGIVINISNPCDVITKYLAEKLGARKGQVFGTGTALDTSRLISAIAHKTGLSRESITGYMMGEHGNLQFAPKSLFSIHGAPLEKAVPDLGKLDWSELEKEAIDGGWLTFSGKQCTEYGIAATAARLAKAVLEDEQVLLPVSAPLEGEYGIEGVYAGVPAIIGKNGVERVVEMPLVKDELERLVSCTDGIKDNLAKAQAIEDEKIRQ